METNKSSALDTSSSSIPICTEEQQASCFTTSSSHSDDNVSISHRTRGFQPPQQPPDKPSISLGGAPRYKPSPLHVSYTQPVPEDQQTKPVAASKVTPIQSPREKEEFQFKVPTIAMRQIKAPATVVKENIQRGDAFTKLRTLPTKANPSTDSVMDWASTGGNLQIDLAGPKGGSSRQRSGTDLVDVIDPSSAAGGGDTVGSVLVDGDAKLSMGHQHEQDSQQMPNKDWQECDPEQSGHLEIEFGHGLGGQQGFEREYGQTSRHQESSDVSSYEQHTRATAVQQQEMLFEQQQNASQSDEQEPIMSSQDFSNRVSNFTKNYNYLPSHQPLCVFVSLEQEQDLVLEDLDRVQVGTLSIC